METFDAPKITELMHEMSSVFGRVNPNDRFALLETSFDGIDHLEVLLKTDRCKGIAANVEERREVLGSNKMPAAPRRPFFRMLLDAFLDPTMIILSLAAVVSLALGLAFPEQAYVADCQCYVSDSSGWVEGVAILVAVLIVIVATALQDFDKELKFRALQAFDVRFAKVIRDGLELEVVTEDICVGDLVVLEVGKAIPVDGFVVKGTCLVDESSVTGESESATKSPTGDVFVFCNTFVVDGQSSVIATEVGKHSTWGETLIDMTYDPGKETQLQIQLWKLIQMLGIAGVFLSLVTFMVLYLYWALDTAEFIQQTAWQASYINGLIEAIIISLTLIIVALPEGLPLAVMIVQAYSSKAMAKEHCLVRQLAACEVSGSVAAICTDKTGTLTQNRMAVKSVWFSAKLLDVEKALNLPDGPLRGLLMDAIVLNSTAFVQNGKNVGSATEVALLEFTEVDYEQIRRARAAELVSQIPFNSETKQMTSVYGSRVFVKGAPEMVMDRCST